MLRPLLRKVPETDLGSPWDDTESLAKPSDFGSGSKHHFGWYLEGESRVHVSSVDDIVTWLSECQYVSDRTLFNEQDFWQHPVTFEALRRGDCEDYALWAWRKAIEMGLDARFMAGRVGPRSHHAWVMLIVGENRYIYDPTRPGVQALVPWRQCAHEYEPWFSVARDLKPRKLNGYYIALRDRILSS